MPYPLTATSSSLSYLGHGVAGMNLILGVKRYWHGILEDTGFGGWQRLLGDKGWSVGQGTAQSPRSRQRQGTKK